jgi:hypothetical protein
LNPGRPENTADLQKSRQAGGSMAAAELGKDGSSVKFIQVL